MRARPLARPRSEQPPRDLMRARGEQHDAARSNTRLLALGGHAKARARNTLTCCLRRMLRYKRRKWGRCAAQPGRWRMLLWPCGVGEEQWCLLLRRCCSLALVCARAAAAHLRLICILRAYKQVQEVVQTRSEA